MVALTAFLFSCLRRERGEAVNALVAAALGAALFGAVWWVAARATG